MQTDPAPSGDPVPLAWVQAAEPSDAPAYVNVGDALSPFLVSMVSGRPTIHAPFRSDGYRVAAIGTIGQNLVGGRVAVWGSGCSPWSDPLNPLLRKPYVPPREGSLDLRATRGPMSARLLSGGGRPTIPYGDPAALLPRFHATPIAPLWDLGVVLHLSELADRALVAAPKPGIGRYATPRDGSVRLITMVAEPTHGAIRDKIDEIRACRRIVSTSLHGYAIAAAYGVPCLYIGSDRGPDGVTEAALDGDEAERVNARFVDLLLGCGRRRMVYWRQNRRALTDWDALIRAVDAHGEPPAPDGDALMAACPAGVKPLAPPSGGSVWDHPLLRAAPIRRRRVEPWRLAEAARIGRRLWARIGR